jgi:DNA-binding HxlR family transcriptional regulator
MLTLTLKHLQRSGLITLTPLGTSLLTTVLKLASWSARHHTEIRNHQATFDRRTP